MKVYVVILFVLLFSSCMRFEDKFFEPSSIYGYQFDEYKGVTDISLDSYYNISYDKINLFQVTSDENGDKANIYAVYVGDIDRISQDTVIVFCHGNSEHMDYYWPRTKLLANIGWKNRYGVITFDYRGYGLSEGKPSEENLYADTEAVLNWLKEKGLTGDRLIMYGFSLGSAPVVQLTANPRILNPSKIILEAPFASVDAFLKDATVFAIPGSYITNVKINNSIEITKVEQPLQWLHGTEDEVINIESHGRLVFNNHNGLYKEGYEIAGASHQNLPVVMRIHHYLNTLENFISKNKEIKK
jgi:pimeloyl-ACP methyl ester carboxylesterase